MAGTMVPLVLIPRHTTYAGASEFTTIAMEVTDYSKAIVNQWRGKLIGTSPTITLEYQESTDQDNWSTCSGGSASDPGQETETQVTATLTKRWFRVKVTLGGTDPIATCWAIGFLEMRET